jgi:hypothetical protein
MSATRPDPADFSTPQPTPEETPRPLWKPRPKLTWPPDDFSQAAFEQRRKERLEEIRRSFERRAAGEQPGAESVPTLPGAVAGATPKQRGTAGGLLVAPPTLAGTPGASDPSAPVTDAESTPTLPGRDAGATSEARQATTLPAGCPLRSLSSALMTYVNIGAAEPQEPDGDLLAVLEERVPLPAQPDRLQTLLVTLFEGHLTMAAQRRTKRKPATGGWRQPNRVTPADLEQWYYLEERILRDKLSGLVYDWVAEDVRVLARLGRATGLAYQRRAKDEQATWKGRQRATARVLLRVYQLAEHLAKIGGEWLAEVCLRRAFRDLWQEQFVTRVPYPDELAPFIASVALPEEQRALIVPILQAEQEAGGKVPLPFVPVLRAQGSEQECRV